MNKRVHVTSSNGAFIRKINYSKISTAFKHSKKDRKALLALAFCISSFALMTSVRLKKEEPELVFLTPAESEVSIKNPKLLTELKSDMKSVAIKREAPEAIINSGTPERSFEAQN